MMDLLIFLGGLLTSFVLGLHIGVKSGVEMSMKTAVNETIRVLLEKAEVLGCKEQVEKVIMDVFDIEKLKEDEQG